ncbi:MAG TPA: hypothetical protein VNM14_15940 [Planctomycetota bacterium]|jgi:hypothetical protein|nr:hypothetical protein [Planctomycetota bacterium]
MALVLATCAAGWGVGLVILCGFHATGTIGVTGGPNHGEHPFIVNLVHLGVAFWATKDWPPKARWTYIGLVGAGVLLGILAMRLVGASPKVLWSARVVMIALYLALLGILLLGR